MPGEALAAGTAREPGQVLPETRSDDSSPEWAEELLEVRDVVKRWGALTVLDGVTLSLAAGTLVQVVGRNGTGKTTLVRVMAGLLLPDSGRLAAGGVSAELDRRGYQSQVGFLPAGNSGLYARLSVRHNLEFWTGLALVPRRERGTRIERALARFGLEQLADRRADRLSLGQRQRVRLAMTFMHEPRVVLLDEPTSSLDDDGVAIVADALAEFVGAGGAALCCAPADQQGLVFDSGYHLEGGRLTPA
ncbi:MAG: heme ABC exporter ATP-binding protein CcmA [Chloroflexota bacterium]|nr:heme ABC exporter ATP-binding protein CcmA [Chloroflexota bacterium]